MTPFFWIRRGDSFWSMFVIYVLEVGEMRNGVPYLPYDEMFPLGSTLDWVGRKDELEEGGRDAQP